LSTVGFLLTSGTYPPCPCPHFQLPTGGSHHTPRDLSFDCFPVKKYFREAWNIFFVIISLVAIHLFSFPLPLFIMVSPFFVVFPSSFTYFLMFHCFLLSPLFPQFEAGLSSVSLFSLALWDKGFLPPPAHVVRMRIRDPSYFVHLGCLIPFFPWPLCFNREVFPRGRSPFLFSLPFPKAPSSFNQHTS